MKNKSIFTLLIFLVSCSVKESAQELPSKEVQVLLTTTLGEITLKLSDKTPQHRDNFMALVREGAYDSLLFHRVIEGFVIQGGDPESKYAGSLDTLGSGGRAYNVPAEFDSTLFHKRGALGAARTGNPDRASSSMQFYIVQASMPVVDSAFAIAEGRINGWLKSHYHINAPENREWYDSLKKVLAAEDWERYSKLSDTLKVLSESFSDFEEYAIPSKHQAIYSKMGGTPHLDQNYTVFGEVISGMDVVDSIADQAVNDQDRPVSDIRILKAKVLE